MQSLYWLDEVGLQWRLSRGEVITPTHMECSIVNIKHVAKVKLQDRC